MGKKKKDDSESKSIKISKSALVGIILLVVIFIGSFIFFTFVFKENKNNKAIDGEVQDEEIKKKDLVNLSLGEEFVVNLAESGNKRYIKTNIVVAYDKNNKEFAKIAEESVVKLRDAVINYLKLVTVEDTKDTEKMKQGLIESLNKAIGGKKVIEDVYFQSLIVQ